MVTSKDIKANPEKITAIINMQELRSYATFNRLIPGLSS